MKQRKELLCLDKPSECIHVDHNLSGPAMRVYNCLLAYCRDEIREIEEHRYMTIPLRVLMDHMQTRNKDRLKEWARELSDASVEFNNIGKGGPSWGYYKFIQEPEIRGQYLRFGMAETLREMIADSKMFATINMLVERKFKKTKYALPLYELGLDYRNNSKDPFHGKPCTPWMDLEDFRGYMGAKGKYKTFKALNQKLISPALKEIEAESDIILNMETDTGKGKRIQRIRFGIEDNNANMSAAERIRRLQATLPIEGTEGMTGVEITHYIDIMTKIYEVHIPRAKKIARGYVGYKEDFTRICHLIDQKKLAGQCKGKFGGWAAKIFEAEAPMLKLTKSSNPE